MIAVHNDHTNHIKLFGGLDCSVKDYSLNQQQEIANKSIHCWKIHLRKNLVKHQLLQGHDGPINSILISRRSKNRLFSGSEDATIHVRDVAVRKFHFIREFSDRRIHSDIEKQQKLNHVHVQHQRQAYCGIF